MHVEDHPLDYGDYEGTIPKGEYGGGTVIVWDRGRWSPIGDARKGYAKGHLDFELAGEKLRGRWHLVRMAGKHEREARELAADQGRRRGRARRRAPPTSWRSSPESVKTGRSVERWPARSQAGRPGRAGSRRPRKQDADTAPDGAQAEGCQEGAAPRLRRAAARHARAQAAGRQALDPRDQVRRLPPPGPHRWRPRHPADPQRARLDGPVRQARSSRRSRALPSRWR